MFATDPNQTPRRADRKSCPICEASASGCRSIEWLRGRRCCEACGGNHDEGTVATDAAS